MTLTLKHPRQHLAATTALLLTTACGYTVVQTHAPFGQQRIAIVPFAEEQPAGIAGILTDQLARHLATGGVQLGLSADAADAILSGRVITQTMSTSPIGAGGITAYRLSITVEAFLKGRDGRLMWRKTLRGNEEFLKPNSTQRRALANEASRRTALQRLAEQLARELHDDLVLQSSADPSA